MSSMLRVICVGSKGIFLYTVKSNSQISKVISRSKSSKWNKSSWNSRNNSKRTMKKPYLRMVQLEDQMIKRPLVRMRRLNKLRRSRRRWLSIVTMSLIYPHPAIIQAMVIKSLNRNLEGALKFLGRCLGTVPWWRDSMDQVHPKNQRVGLGVGSDSMWMWAPLPLKQLKNSRKLTWKFKSKTLI